MLEILEENILYIILITLQAIIVLISFILPFISVIKTNARAKNEGMKFISGFHQDFRLRLHRASTSIGEDILNLEYASDSKQKTEILQQLAIDIRKLTYVLNWMYDPDRLIIMLTDIMFKQASEYVETGNGLSNLQISYDYFYKEVSLDSIVQWTRMKEQAKGINIELGSWGKHYGKERKSYENLKHIHTYDELKNYIISLKPEVKPLETTLDKYCVK